MADDFDGYRKWLGISDKKRPPTHYDLLGISLDEDDPEVIHAAAEQRRRFVESKRGDGHEKIVTEILYRIDESEATLLNNEMRRGYDRQLDLFGKRQKSRQVDPNAPRSRIRSRPGPTVGEGTGFVSTFAGIVAVLCVGFGIMAWFSFQMPWAKLEKDADVGQSKQQIVQPIPSVVEENKAEDKFEVAADKLPAAEVAGDSKQQIVQPIPSVVEENKAEDKFEVAADKLPAAEVAGDSNPVPISTPEFVPLFDGKTLGGWKVSNFGGNGKVTVVGGHVLLGSSSNSSTGITLDGSFPTSDYEVIVEAKRVTGNDFFCGITFPVGDSSCSLIVGGWGGGVVGLSSIDGKDASQNQTTSKMTFVNDRWYAVRLLVTPVAIKGWIDEAPVIDQPIKGRTFSIRKEIEPSRPFGIACWKTTAALRSIKWRDVLPPNK